MATRKSIDFSALTPGVSEKEYNRFRDAMRKRHERADAWLPGDLKSASDKLFRKTQLPTWKEFQTMNKREKRAAIGKTEKYIDSPLSSKTGYKAFRSKTEETLMKRKSIKNKADLTNKDVREIQKMLGSTAGKHLDSDQLIEVFTNTMRKEHKTAEQAREDIENLVDSYTTNREVQEALSEREKKLRNKRIKKSSNKAKGKR